ncbi:MAG: polysaccharide deacetylase family protein [Cyclobacteriaceae bacterium]
MLISCTRLKAIRLIKLFFLVTILAWPAEVQAQEAPIRLIIRSDDMGFSHAANHAMIETYEKGITTSVEIMVPTPWFPEAVRLLKEHPDLDVGIHITLTSEWSNVKWRPLTKAPGLADEDGYFFPMIWPNSNYGPEQALREQDWTLEEVEAEMRAQIETALHHLPHISHLSAHMGCTSMAPEVEEVYRKLSAEYGLDIHPEDLGVKRARYAGPTDTPALKRQSFINMLRQLTPGTYLFVDHPAYDVPEVRGIHHTGYEDVAVDRQGVTNILTDPEVIQLIKDLQIDLVSYADLKK